MQNNKTLILFENICKNSEDEFVAEESIDMDPPSVLPKTLLFMPLIVSICELKVDCTSLSGRMMYQKEKALQTW